MNFGIIADLDIFYRYLLQFLNSYVKMNKIKYILYIIYRVFCIALKI